MPSEDFTERILRFLSRDDYRPQRIRAVAREMGIAEDEYGTFRQTIKALSKTGRVALGSRNILMLPEPSGTIVGTFRANPRGFGFVIPELPTAHGDLYVPEGETMDALTGDLVRARVLKQGHREGKMVYKGRIVEILQRGQSQYVGELYNEYGRWFVRPDGRTFHGPIFIDDASSRSAKAGDQVVVEILQYPNRGLDARGVIVKVLGERGLPDVTLKSILWQYGYPDAFPEDVLAETRKRIADYDPEAAAANREDLRDRVLITIDPDDAKDYDDAISIEWNDGQVELGVHIADVSHFVKTGSRLDDEAAERANSVYFPGHVVPMLPEVLSNGLCSLQEDQPRLTKSAFIRYDNEGEVVSQRVANTIIRSAKRLTYNQATAILDGQHEGFVPEVVKLVQDAERLARRIRARRLREGMLVLDLPEIELVFDDDKNMIGVEPADTAFSHTIIEMFMVEANEAVARLFVNHGIPNLRRIHPDPEPGATDSLKRYLAAVGMKAPAEISRESIQAILREAKNRKDGFALNLAVLRSLEQAIYSPKLIGHFALASRDYVHFTSPIRRYPDLTIHRLLDAYLSGKLDTKRGISEVPQTEDLTRIGGLCSIQERRAEDAEREYKLVRMLQFLEDRKGDEFEGVITGLTNFGVFVQLREFLVDGLLRFDDLPDDWWEVDAERGTVIGQATGLKLRLGQSLTVAIANINVAGRQLDLSLFDVKQLGKADRTPGPIRKRSNTRRRPSSRPSSGTPRRGGHKKTSRRKHRRR